MEGRITSWQGFWPYYVRAHLNPINRKLHFVGTTCAAACLAGAALGPLWLLMLVPVAGYGFAWTGHFFFEGNRPATWKHPLYSLAGDLIMWSKMLRGTMDDEIKRVLAEPPRSAVAA